MSVLENTKVVVKFLKPVKKSIKKGVHLENRQIKLNYLTKKDFEAIKIGERFKIKNYALSFTNSPSDVTKFNSLLKNKNKILKLKL